MQPTPHSKRRSRCPRSTRRSNSRGRRSCRPHRRRAHCPRMSVSLKFSQAASNAYNALVFGHLQRFKRYPRALRGVEGTVVVRFALDRTGRVIESAVTKSSGNRALDQEIAQGVVQCHRAGVIHKRHQAGEYHRMFANRRAIDNGQAHQFWCGTSKKSAGHWHDRRGVQGRATSIVRYQ